MKRWTIDPKETEGELRERLAEFFIAYDQETCLAGEDAEHLHEAQRFVYELDTQSILQHLGFDRPLLIGDPARLFDACFCACQTLAQQKKLHLSYTPAPQKEVLCGVEPHILTMAAVGLVREALLKNKRGGIEVVLKDTPTACRVTVTGKRAVTDADTLALIKEAARLHEGTLVASGGCTAFYIRKNQGGVGICRAPTQEELLQSPVSCVQTGFYSFFC